MAGSQTLAAMAELSDADKAAVLLQVDRLLASSHFRNSRRYSDFLRFVVTKTAEGHADILKERTIGIEVFGREPTFDTSGDSIVRVAAAEVRKRIAQYYQEEGHEHELRVDLPSGSYVAHFRRPETPLPAVVILPESSPSIEPKTGAYETRRPTVSLRWKVSAIVAASLVLLAIAASFVLHVRSDSGINRFWGPVFESSAPVIVCVGTVEPSHISKDFRNRFTVQMANSVNGLEEPLVPTPQLPDWPAVTWIDAVELARIAEMLTRHNKTAVLRSSENATLADLRAGPVILLGVLENTWSLRLVSNLRFHPRMDFASQKMWIEDAQHPERKQWSAPWGIAYSDTHDDYALVTRTRDPLSGQISVEIGGLGLHASQAAAEFATNPNYLKSLSDSLHDPNRNVQIVLKINVIKGEASPPQVVAENYW
jgi:hypothetical protein